MKKVLILGAFDRYNYGDLLFPLIIERQLQIHDDNLSFRFYGINSSNLEQYGGKATLNISEFYRQCNNNMTPVNIIIAGGEALGVSWLSLYSALSKFGLLLQSVGWKFKCTQALNLIAKTALSGKTKFPFNFTTEEFSSTKSICYNSLGGSHILNFSPRLRNVLKGTVKNADILSVRDRKSLNNLGVLGVKARLAPDSAILMSEFFPESYLYKKVSKETKDFVNKYAGNYIFFQTNKMVAENNTTELISQLQRIKQNEDIEVCFCPIGLAIGHSDYEGLELLKRKLTFNAKLFKIVTIWDIMYLISKSKIYIGTSLHGTITAMSYNIPYIGLLIKKLDSYLNTWGVESSKQTIEITDLTDKYVSVIKTKKEELIASSILQKNEARKTFELIYKELK